MRRSSSHPTNARGIPAPPPHHNRPLIYHHRSSSSNNNNNFPATRNAHRLSPNFIIDLHLDPTITPSNKRPDPNIVNSVISQCKPTPPPDRTIFPTTTTSRTKLTASLHFQEWSHTLNFMTALWELRLRGAHSFTPKLQSHILVASDTEELKRNLTKKFSDYIEGFIEGVASNVNDDENVVGRWQAKVSEKSDEIAQVTRLLKGRNKPRNFIELNERKKGLMAERDLIVKRLREFRASMNCILKYIEGGREKEGERGLEVFVFDGEIDWERIHRLVLREIRRLVDGLPIYAYRQQILEMIHSKQVMVLIGETGSGKSTQLVQFLTDSGIAVKESIVCTQPRKIAAISLADRVNEECRGCYENSSVMSYPTFSSTQQFGSNVIFMTDHCLLQHYMNDTTLSGISCIIVDEAHERSLNTDLLLALIRGLLCERRDLRLVIMSATADAKQLSDYFYGCEIFHVEGRNFPVEVRYTPSSEGTAFGNVSPYVHDILRTTTEIHKQESEGTILAFLTSQMEVEWACEKFDAPSAVALALHGKLPFEEQSRVFQDFDAKRKVIFATNLAETSLTIPGVKYVVDSGLAKESKFEAATGMNVLRVCRISQSSAQQRAGRAGRTVPGICYRLYTESDFESMSPNQEPEIRRVHLGVAVLRMLALGIKNVQEFDFVDAPSAKAIDMAIRNLVQLGAITLKGGICELTEEGRYMVKLGIEPRLGKIIISSLHYRLGKEGLVLAAVMANARSIFCRVGSEDDKQKADCLKVQFCHRNGDLFTVLSVYKEWEAVPQDRRNRWCWENSINAKSMRRCQDTVKELEFCLEKELTVIIPSYWNWNSNKSTEHDKNLKKIILSALAENVAMHSGHDRLGYKVALTEQHIQLHPSCSLLAFGEKPNWVVFSELLSISNDYLVCVTAFDVESLSMLCPPPLFDALKMESQKLQVKVLTSFGSSLLKRFCGKSNSNLHSLVTRIRIVCMDERIGVEVHVDKNEILLFATAENMQKVFSIVSEAVECERKWLHNECMEKFLYLGADSSPMALFGAGAEIKYLELEKRCLTVDIFFSNANTIDDKELLMFLEEYTSGTVCSIHKSIGSGQEGDEKEKWGQITFLSPDAARKAAQLNEVEFKRSKLKVVPSQTIIGGNHKMFPFPAVKAKLCWPRKVSKGLAIVKCYVHEVNFMICDFSNLIIGGRYVRCNAGRCADSVVVSGFGKELSEADILGALRSATNRRILDFFIVRGDAVENPPLDACEKALSREISPFMPKRNPQTSCWRVQVFPPELKDTFMKAFITFDGRLHLEAARALEHMEGKVLPGFLSWQKIKCERIFHSLISCSASIYVAIKKQLDSLLASFNRVKGAECSLDRNENGSYRVRISADATKTVAELRRPLEELMRGKIINHPSLTPTIIQHLFSSQGINLMKSIQRETGTYIHFDRRNFSLKIFGCSDKIAPAQQKFVQLLLADHESKQLEIHLRGRDLPPDLMKEVVKRFGPDLHGLKEKVPGAELTLSTRHHVISVRGDKELKQKVEEIIFEMAQMGYDSAEKFDGEDACPICLCEFEDAYQLESCGHLFCRMCLVGQLESASKNLDSFPICCTRGRCRAPILLTDLRSLLSSDKLEELFRASLGSFVASSRGTYRFCPSPDCPSVYRVADPHTVSDPFVCGACFAETCTRCHLDYHPYLSCEKYMEFKEDPDVSLQDWCKGKENVKSCPVCGYTIEKGEGCNHVECKCGGHVCWVCLEFYSNSEDCYNHLRSKHGGIA
uniref:RNA helicase n=1 Tax=Salix viminalis TaxID=40686 RepID=A0A6N2L4X2_SALVM